MVVPQWAKRHTSSVRLGLYQSRENITVWTGALCGALLTVCISRWNKKGRSSKPAPNTEKQQQAAVVYEEVDTQSKKFELKENVAYGPAKKRQKIIN